MSIIVKLKAAIVKNGQAVPVDGSNTETLMEATAYGGAKNLRADLEHRLVLFEDKDGDQIVPFENFRKLTLAEKATKAKGAAA